MHLTKANRSRAVLPGEQQEAKFEPAMRRALEFQIKPSLPAVSHHTGLLELLKLGKLSCPGPLHMLSLTILFSPPPLQDHLRTLP